MDAQSDVQLEQAVRRVERMRAAFYIVVLLVALTGQVTGATQKLDIPLIIAVPAVGALELGGVVVMANAQVRRRLGERAIASRVLSAAIAAGAVAFNWLAHDNRLLGGFFAGMSCLGYLVWLMHAENVRRDRLRALGALPATTPAYEPIGHWLRHPLITCRARSMAKADPHLRLYGSLDAARAALRRERRDAAIAKVLRRKIEAAVDPTTATIAVHVYDLDEIAGRLTGTADYDALTSLIAADLTPARIVTGAKRRQQRFGRRRGWAGPRGAEPGNGSPHDAALGDAAGEPEWRPPAEMAAARTHRDPRASVRDLGHPTPAERAKCRIGDVAIPVQPSGLDERPAGSAPTSPELPEARRHDSSGASEPIASGGLSRAPEVPDGTAEAVAYWLSVDPNMRYDEIAQRIGRTERTVCRNLPPGFRRPTVGGRK
ncbi:hypothetical protein ACIBXA_31700 [Micromonospora echinaurantiaca]|uniref:hypothetical protein n=1 Tax=Micromonospora echinaurantiaca TaxID=47857 RepID=UPI00379CD791